MVKICWDPLMYLWQTGGCKSQSVCKKRQMERLNLCGNKAEEAKCGPSEPRIKYDAYSGKQNPSETLRASSFGVVDLATKMVT